MVTFKQFACCCYPFADEIYVPAKRFSGWLPSATVGVIVISEFKGMQKVS